MGDREAGSGGAVPLLERLIDLEPRQPFEPRPVRIYEPDEVRISVRWELERLLNTRRPSGNEEGEVGLTVLDYGVPDLLSYSPDSEADGRRLCQQIARAIEAFEPRLVKPRVSVVGKDDADRSLALRIEGRLRIQPVPMAASFNVVAEERSGKVKVTVGE